ncbi:MAG: bifunctional methylenetetrahydrofolate dehydrogenase/methenyltetrahydrofolate cyclohydrolase FolD [Candidatus Pacebacteria bacterium]|nr:bifunctional methylenetetrahydrofolate dehydrogenase/methenyltetrahydrofolate cyclohydrolase FolD [Candidatus Paceibacterota bacterium]
MTAKTIDGKLAAEKLRQGIAAEVAQLVAKNGRKPGLVVILVGDDPASKVYVANKAKQTDEVGMNSIENRLPVTTSEAELLSLVESYNRDPMIDGILVQLPLPSHIDSAKVLTAIAPDKDVDGFHAVNVGRLWTGDPRALVPCTPSGSMILLRSVLPDLSGAEAVVIGRSNIVGKPMAALLLAANCSVSVVHSRSQNLPSLVKRGDIVIAAVGKADMVKGDWLKPGAIVIDVGINRLVTAEGKARLTGDCDYESCQQVAGAITPVPGGVGPMTIACLLQNTLLSYRMRLA